MLIADGVTVTVGMRKVTVMICGAAGVAWATPTLFVARLKKE
jgi:hypothetical protein